MTGPCTAALKNNMSVVGQMFPSKPKFSVDQIPDMTSRVVLITGGNVGIGYETAKALLNHHAKVYIAARSKERALKAIATLREETGNEAFFLELDLADLASVKRAASEFLVKESQLHILFNNAGVMWPSVDQITKDGYDLQWGTNVVGHYYFTELLLPALLAGVKSSPDAHARIITTSSSSAYLSTLDWDTFKDGVARRKMSTESLYNQSKFGNVVVARQVAKRYANMGIVSISLNPGNIRTELQRNVPETARKIMNAVVLAPAPLGALTQLFAGTMPEALDYNGEFLVPYARLGKCRREAYDDELGEQLWRWLEGEVRAFEQR